MYHHNVISLDLAKRIIQISKVSPTGEIFFNKAVSPKKAKEIIANSKPCIVAMEGCGSFHHWGRFAQTYGHIVRGMPPKKVKPFVGKQKTDANDTIGIAVAVRQPNMTFCQVMTIEQQNLQAIQTSRRFLDKSLTQIGNHIHALLYEYGVKLNTGKKSLRLGMAQYASPEDETLPTIVKELLVTLQTQWQETELQYKVIDKLLQQQVTQSEPCKRLMQLEGVAKIGAAGLFCSLGDGQGFKNGRQASVYIGSTPKQHSSGGKTIMVGIDKKGGDKKLRSTLYLGALSYICALPSEPKTEKQRWLINLIRRAGVKRACIALVNKTIRTAWALLRSGESYTAVPLKSEAS
jgi:transposase